MKRVGIIGCSEIAFRRFMPAIQSVENLQVIAVAEEFAPQKLDEFCTSYNLEGLSSFSELIQREDIDCIYVPQPPALHFQWAKEALIAGKHVLVEKPSTLSYRDSKELVDIASKQDLALHENYMFVYHPQIKRVKEIIKDGTLGDIRLVRGDFGFPLREANDFRYNKALGGGALLDAAGYTVKLATELLGPSIKVDTSSIQTKDGYEVEMAGTISLSNEEGVVYQAGFGMDNSYKCSLEVWGSKGRLETGRIFTAPPQLEPTLLLHFADGSKEITVNNCDHFSLSIQRFADCISDAACRTEDYDAILLQAKLIDQVKTNNIQNYWNL